MKSKDGFYKVAAGMVGLGAGATFLVTMNPVFDKKIGPELHAEYHVTIVGQQFLATASGSVIGLTGSAAATIGISNS